VVVAVVVTVATVLLFAGASIEGEGFASPGPAITVEVFTMTNRHINAVVVHRRRFSIECIVGFIIIIIQVCI
jgi:hypothetical protein